MRDLINAQARAQMVSEYGQRYQDKLEREKALSQDAEPSRHCWQICAQRPRAEAERKAEAAHELPKKAERDAVHCGPLPADRPASPQRAAAIARSTDARGGRWSMAAERQPVGCVTAARMPDGRTSSGVLIAAPAGSR